MSSSAPTGTVSKLPHTEVEALPQGHQTANCHSPSLLTQSRSVLPSRRRPPQPQRLSPPSKRPIHSPERLRLFVLRLLRLFPVPPLSRPGDAAQHRRIANVTHPQPATRTSQSIPSSARRRARSPPFLYPPYTRQPRERTPPSTTLPPDTIMPNTSRNPDPPSPQTSTCPEDSVPRPDSATPPWPGTPATRTPSPSSMPEISSEVHAPPLLPADADSPATPRSAAPSPGEGVAADEEGCDEDGRKGWKGRREEGLDFREDGYSATSMGPDFADVRV